MRRAGSSSSRPTAAPPDLAARLAQRLQLWTGVRWGVAVVGSRRGGDDRRGAGGASKGDLRARSLAHPMVQAVLAAFPGAEIRDGAAGGRAGRLAAAAPAAGEDEDDDWDPFDPLSEES